MKTSYEAYAQILIERVSEGWAPFLITFMFDQMPGGECAVQRQQTDLVQEAYALFVTRVVRKPIARSQTDRLPIWICAPDFPVFKHAKHSSQEVIINDGQHMHGIAVLPPWSRHAFDMAKHFELKQSLYVGHNRLSRLHATRVIDDELPYVCEYATKSIAHRRVDHDTLLVLPRSRSELMRTPTSVGRDSSVFGKPKVSRPIPLYKSNDPARRLSARSIGKT